MCGRLSLSMLLKGKEFVMKEVSCCDKDVDAGKEEIKLKVKGP